MKAIQISKQQVFVSCLFLLFFPIKTQFYNLSYIVFDAVLNSGAVSDIYTFNYLGLLVGCQEILDSKKVLGVQFEVFHSVVFYFFLILSLVASIIFFKRKRSKRNFKFFDWILLIIFSFQLFDVLEKVIYYMTIPDYFTLETSLDWISFLKNMVILIIAFVIFFRVCNRSVQKQILLLALPAAIASFMLWFFVVGPNILPIITL